MPRGKCMIQSFSKLSLGKLRPLPLHPLKEANSKKFLLKTQPENNIKLTVWYWFCIAGCWSSRWANSWSRFTPWTMPSLSQISTASRSTPVNVSPSCRVNSPSSDWSPAVPLVLAVSDVLAAWVLLTCLNCQMHLIVLAWRSDKVADLWWHTTEVFSLYPVEIS